MPRELLLQCRPLGLLDTRGESLQAPVDVQNNLVVLAVLRDLLVTWQDSQGFYQIDPQQSRPGQQSHLVRQEAALADRQLAESVPVCGPHSLLDHLVLVTLTLTRPGHSTKSSPLPPPSPPPHFGSRAGLILQRAGAILRAGPGEGESAGNLQHPGTFPVTVARLGLC